MRVAVLGGGISGCTLAAELARRPELDVTLIERSQRLGGLHRSVEVGPYLFDIGAFVFGWRHSIFSVFPYLKEVFPPVKNRFGSVRPGGILDDYPLSVGGVRRQFGSAFVGRVVAEVLASKVLCRRKQSVRAFIYYYIGPSLYRASGLKTYVERLYLAPDSEIGLEFAEKRLNVIGDSASLRVNLAKVARAIVRGVSPAKVVRADTATAVRVRPAEGFDDVYRRIGNSLEKAGVRLRCGSSVERVEQVDGEFVLHGLEGNDRFQRVFSTIPLEAMAGMLGMNGYTVPDYMDLYSLFYEYDGPLDFDFNVLHNFTDHGQWKRLTMLSRYYGTHAGKHYFTIEGTALEGGDREQILRTATADFERWLEREPLLEGRPRFLNGLVSHKAYPVYKTRTARGVQHLQQAIEDRGIILAGRQGKFNYISSSDAAGNARDVARSFLTELLGPAGVEPA